MTTRLELIRPATAAGLAATLLFALGACSGSGSKESFEGSWGSEETGKPSLTIAADGAFNGTDGCNTMVGHGSVSGDTFHFGQFAITMMHCEGVDTWLSKASTATRSGQTLKIKSEDGSAIGSLEER
jgi:heat shock protein HslJ